MRADPGGVPLSRHYMLSQEIMLAIDAANAYHLLHRILTLVRFHFKEWFLSMKKLAINQGRVSPLTFECLSSSNHANPTPQQRLYLSNA